MDNIEYRKIVTRFKIYGQATRKPNNKDSKIMANYVFKDGALMTKAFTMTTDNGEEIEVPGGKIVVPESRRELVFFQSHVSHCSFPGVPHLSRGVTRQIVKDAFWWKDMEKDIDDYLRRCHHCWIDTIYTFSPNFISDAYFSWALLDKPLQELTLVSQDDESQVEEMNKKAELESLWLKNNLKKMPMAAPNTGHFITNVLMLTETLHEMSEMNPNEPLAELLYNKQHCRLSLVFALTQIYLTGNHYKPRNWTKASIYLEDALSVLNGFKPKYTLQDLDLFSMPDSAYSTCDFEQLQSVNHLSINDSKMKVPGFVNWKPASSKIESPNDTATDQGRWTSNERFGGFAVGQSRGSSSESNSNIDKGGRSLGAHNFTTKLNSLKKSKQVGGNGAQSHKEAKMPANPIGMNICTMSDAVEDYYRGLGGHPDNDEKNLLGMNLGTLLAIVNGVKMKHMEQVIRATWVQMTSTLSVEEAPPILTKFFCCLLSTWTPVNDLHVADINFIALTECFSLYTEIFMFPQKDNMITEVQQVKKRFRQMPKQSTIYVPASNLNLRVALDYELEQNVKLVHDECVEVFLRMTKNFTSVMCFTDVFHFVISDTILSETTLFNQNFKHPAGKCPQELWEDALRARNIRI